MVMIRHPLSRTEYYRNDDGTVRVASKGKEGIFDRHGQWLSGARRTADAALCQWVADGLIPPGMALSAPIIRGNGPAPAELPPTELPPAELSLVELPAGDHGV